MEVLTEKCSACPPPPPTHTHTHMRARARAHKVMGSWHLVVIPGHSLCHYLMAFVALAQDAPAAQRGKDRSGLCLPWMLRR